ncbi:hypothetical protein DERF_007803 [Dermatophagoides farinae]|uniref:Uncharacterized protein n=1 Tax=Dermatophagoides farinae TaxID=6954 RepID=A0A922HYN4_DERFA|nr:hypothetical protein DERF_007803 [Dermatophagoides farinae]
MNKLPEVDIMAINSPPRTSKLISSSTRNFCRLKPQSRRQLDDLSTSYIKSLTTKCGCLANGGDNRRCCCCCSSPLLPLFIVVNVLTLGKPNLRYVNAS